MATLQISDELYADLQRAAETSHIDRDALVHDALSIRLDSLNAPSRPLTDLEKVRLKESIEQARRGELIPGEEIERKFAAWFQRLDEREAAGE